MKNKYFISFILIILNSFLIITAFFLAAFSFNFLIEKKLKMFFIFSSLDILCVLLAYVIGIISNLYINKILEWKALKLIEDILKNKISQINLINFNESNNAKYLSWITNDIEQIKMNKLNKMFGITKYLSRLFFILIALFYFSWILAIIAIIFALLSWKISIYLSQKYKNLDLNYSVGTEEYFVNLENNFSSVETFYRFNKIDLINQQFKQTLENRKNLNLNFNKENFKLNFWIYIVTLTPQFALISIVSILAFFGYVIFGAIVSVGFMISSFFSNSSNIASEISAFLKSKNLFKKHFEIQKSFNSEFIDISEFQSLNIQNLSIKKDEQNFSLNNFDFIFERGKKYLIKGKSGSGKTLLIKTLLNYETKFLGKFDYNEINSKKISQKNLGNFIEYIESKNFIFYDTIINNVTLWESQPNFKKINEIFNTLKISYLKLDFEISNAKFQISEGEKQLLALARALYFNKKIWFIDESFNNIDSERIIQIEKLIFQKNITLIYVSHDFKSESIEFFDKVIDLDGEIYD